MVAPQSLELRSRFFLLPIEGNVSYGFARVWDHHGLSGPKNEGEFLSVLGREVRQGNYVTAARLALQSNFLEIIIEGGKIRKEAGFKWDLPHLGLKFSDLRKLYTHGEEFADAAFDHSCLIDQYLEDEVADLSGLDPITLSRDGIEKIRPQLPSWFLDRYDKHNPRSVSVYSPEPFVEDDASAASDEPTVQAPAKLLKKEHPLLHITEVFRMKWRGQLKVVNMLLLGQSDLVYWKERHKWRMRNPLLI